VPQEWSYAQKFMRVWDKNLGRGSWVEAKKLAFFFSRETLPAMRHCRQICHWKALDKLQAHTQADNGAHCADKIETGTLVLTGRRMTPARILHTAREMVPWAGEKRNGAAYVMPD